MTVSKETTLARGEEDHENNWLGLGLYLAVSGDTVVAFKIRLDRFWLHQEINYNWKADIHIGSHSQVNVIKGKKVKIAHSI